MLEWQDVRLQSLQIWCDHYRRFGYSIWQTHVTLGCWRTTELTEVQAAQTQQKKHPDSNSNSGDKNASLTKKGQTRVARCVHSSWQATIVNLCSVTSVCRGTSACTILVHGHCSTPLNEELQDKQKIVAVMTYFRSEPEVGIPKAPFIWSNGIF